MKPYEEAVYGLTYTVVAILIFGAGIWGGATIKGAKMDTYMDIAVQNAISHTLATSGSMLSCKDNEIIEAVKSLAENGAHINGFALRIDINNTLGLF